MANAWLKDLEDKVHAASKALRAVRAENDELRARVKELESRTDAAKGEGWQQERDEIRERVEKLADHLAGLLDEA